ncbi:hypothetical protein RJ035_000765 [Blastomyces gilchristii]
MPRTRRLLREEITYSVAKEREVNVLHQLGSMTNKIGNNKVNVFSFASRFHTVLEKTSDLEMGMKRYDARPVPMHGLKKLTRCANSTIFTRIDNLPFINRCFRYLHRRLLSFFGLPVPSRYYRHSNRTQTSQDGVMGAGYLLIECIDQDGETMLSNTCQIPLPHIGSFIIDYNGFLRLSNRPLSIEIQQLENEKIPTHIPRDYTYSTVESYVMDMLAIHDSQLQNQPNAVNNLEDCASQMSALAAMRTIFPLFFQQKFRRGPFTFTLTDLHQSNIFVDDNWHISRLVDLEWACSRPIEMVEMPYWLTNKGVDEIDAEEYNTIRMELMAALETEETKRSSSAGLADIGRSIPGLPATMEQVWASGTFSRSPVPQASSEYSTTISSPCYPIIFLRKSGRSCPFYG